MNAFIKNYLKDHPNTLVSYVRDSKGFVKGVVVAIAKDKIGWSLVNSGRDSDWVDRKTHQLPAYQRLQVAIRNILAATENIDDEVVKDEIVKSALAASSFHAGLSGLITSVKVPLFERGSGIYHALDRALGDPVVFDGPDAEGAEYIKGTPNDNDLNKAIWKMKERAVKYFR